MYIRYGIYANEIQIANGCVMFDDLRAPIEFIYKEK